MRRGAYHSTVIPVAEGQAADIQALTTALFNASGKLASNIERARCRGFLEAARSFCGLRNPQNRLGMIAPLLPSFLGAMTLSVLFCRTTGTTSSLVPRSVVHSEVSSGRRSRI